jgi:hypothetical protein
VGPRLSALALFVLLGSTSAIFLARAAPRIFPVSDIALTELYTRQAAHLHLLVGPYSRFGWHHAGPVYFYLLAPFYAIGGHHAAALSAGALTLSLLAVALIAWTGGRFMSSTVSIVTLAMLVLFLWRVDPLIVSSWNAHAVVLPSAALIIMSAALACGHTALLPAVAALASLLVQTDVALIPFVMVMVAIAAALAAATGRLDRRLVGITAATLAIVWATPVVEQFSHAHGNLAALWRFFVRGSGERRLTMTQGLAIWSDAITAPFRPAFILANGTPIEPTLSLAHVAVAAALVIAVAAAAVIALRRGMSAPARLAILSLAASLVTLWSATRIEGGVSDHQSFWFAMVGVVDVVSAVAVFPGRRQLRASAAQSAILVLLALVLLIGIRQMDRVRRGSVPVTESAPSAPNFAASIRQYLDRTASRRPLVRLDERQWGLGVAILLELDRRDVAFAVEDSWMPMFPDRFRANGTEDVELTLAARGASVELARRPQNETVDESTFIHVEAVPLRPRLRDVVP